MKSTKNAEMALPKKTIINEELIKRYKKGKSPTFDSLLKEFLSELESLPEKENLVSLKDIYHSPFISSFSSGVLAFGIIAQRIKYNGIATIKKKTIIINNNLIKTLSILK